jgi:hypothetical protein
MWAYYASGHRGFCLRFRTLKGTIFHETEKVEYSVEYPIPPLTADSDEQVKAFLLTKSKCWKHEKEWRSLAPCGKLLDLRGRPLVSSDKPLALRAKPLAPWGLPLAPWGSSLAPRGLALAPWGLSLAPRGLPLAPRG